MVRGVVGGVMWEGAVAILLLGLAAILALVPVAAFSPGRTNTVDAPGKLGRTSAASLLGIYDGTGPARSPEGKG